MTAVFGQERLDAYRVGLEFVGWAYGTASRLSGLQRSARDHLVDASQSITQTIAEGDGKRSSADRRRLFAIARGSALECAAILDNLVACETIGEEKALEGKAYLHRLVCMLTRMTNPVDRVSEGSVEHDHDHEHDREESEAFRG